MAPYLEALEYLRSDKLAFFTFVIGLIAICNGVQNYLKPRFARRVYSTRPVEVTALTSRIFGTWTIFSGLIRTYGAFRLDNHVMYVVIMISYLVVWIHMVLEWLACGTLGLRSGGLASLSPILVSSLALGIMWYSYESYFPTK